MSRKQKAIICDIDDTICAFGQFLTRLWNNEYGTTLTDQDFLKWDFKDMQIKDARGNVTRGKDLYRFFKEYEQHGLYTAMPLLPEALQALNLFKEMEYTIILMTARDKKFEIDTTVNLLINNIVYDDLVFCYDKAREIKKLSKKYDIVAFVDDKQSTVEMVTELCDLPFNFLINRPYNKECNNSKIIRVNNILEVARFLK